MEVTDHLFRRESGRLVAALTRVFGAHRLALAEDVAQDVLVRALEVWKFRGPPENPSAWLLAVAKRRAIDVLRRQRTASHAAPELERQLASEWTLVSAVDELLDPAALPDEQLRMVFACCQPRLAEPAQVALILHILCGFSVGEVASAFLAKPAAMEKRLTRAKALFAKSKRPFDLASPAELGRRLPAVQRALYLLFNEGYHGACPETAVRRDLCQEAMRLAALLVRHPLGATPATHALAALMCFHAARMPARLDEGSRFIPFTEQDRTLWDRALAAQGEQLLEQAAAGAELSCYHVEAAIAAIHARAASAGATDWESIVGLYDALLRLQPSPVVSLHRALALAQQRGPEAGLAALRAIDAASLSGYPFYAASIGELELARGRADAARPHFETALRLARNPTERDHFAGRLAACGGGGKPVRPG